MSSTFALMIVDRTETGRVEAWQWIETGLTEETAQQKAAELVNPLIEVVRCNKTGVRFWPSFQ